MGWLWVIVAVLVVLCCLKYLFRQMAFQLGILEALKDWGLVVIEVDGWKTRGSSDFAPRGHVCHHDVVPDQPGTQDRCPPIIINGRSDLPGPLANFWLERDGNVHLVAAGRANHAGEGSWNGLVGNSTVWGTEANNMGTPADPWPEVQIESWTRLCAATADYSGFPVANVCGHKEWAPTRKIDPHTIDMGAFRRQVELQEKELFTVGQYEDLLTATRNQGQKTRSLVLRLYKAESKQNRRLSDAEVEKILAAVEADD